MKQLPDAKERARGSQTAAIAPFDCQPLQ